MEYCDAVRMISAHSIVRTIRCDHHYSVTVFDHYLARDSRYFAGSGRFEHYYLHFNQ